MTCLMLNLALIPAVTEPTNYKSTSTKAITRVIKPSYLNPYKPGSQLKPRRISNQLAYNQDHSNST